MFSCAEKPTSFRRSRSEHGSTKENAGSRRLKLAQAQKIRVNRVPRPKLDKVHQNNQGIIAEVRVLNGRAVLADLSLDGRSFREILKERVK